MDDPLLVRGVERVGDLARDAERLGDRAAPASASSASRRLQSILERLALDQLEHQRAHLALLLEAVDLRDVGMVQRGENPRFALEAGEPLGVGGEAAGRTLIATSRWSFGSRAR